jgi:hypothetical protein
MKQFVAEVGGRKLFSLWTSRLVGAMAALLLLMAPGAKADVIETFDVSGTLSGPPFGPAIAFNGTFKLDFDDDFANFADPSPKSVDITVQGRSSVFNQGLSVSVGIIGASNSAGDTLALYFAAPPSGSWAGFDEGKILFGYMIFDNVTASVFDAGGEITRDLSDPIILDPPPPITDPVTVPELSTWAMMLLGLAGLGLAARGRRAIGFLAKA